MRFCWKIPEKFLIISNAWDLIFYYHLCNMFCRIELMTFKTSFLKGEVMRRKIILTVAVVIYAIFAAVGIYLGRRDSRPQSTTQPCVSSIAGAEDTMGDITVFVTNNGMWYHRAGCRELQNSRIPVKLSAVRQYCRPCTKCRPQR